MIELQKVIDEYNSYISPHGRLIENPPTFGLPIKASYSMGKLDLINNTLLYYSLRRKISYICIGSINRYNFQDRNLNPNLHDCLLLMLESDSKRNKRIRDIIANPSNEIFDYLQEKNIQPVVVYRNAARSYRIPKFKYAFNT